MRHFFDKFFFAASRFSLVLTRISVVPGVNGNSTRVWGEGIKGLEVQWFYDTEY